MNLSLLETVARLAEQDEAETIEFQMTNEAIPEGRTKVKRKSVEQPTPHQRVFCDIIREDDVLAPGDLYEYYREQVENPKSDRTVRNYLSKLAHYNLIDK